MTRYYADSPDSIGELFDREGDALEKAGFSRPDMSSAPDELTGTSPVNITTQYPSPIEESARLGIDLETYLQG